MYVNIVLFFVVDFKWFFCKKNVGGEVIDGKKMVDFIRKFYVVISRNFWSGVLNLYIVFEIYLCDWGFWDIIELLLIKKIEEIKCFKDYVME